MGNPDYEIFFAGVWCGIMLSLLFRLYKKIWKEGC